MDTRRIVAAFIEPMLSGHVRSPAVPLVRTTHISASGRWLTKLPDQATGHWTGGEQPLVGMIRVDGNVYRYMDEGPSPDVPAMRQLSITVEATRTIYVFEAVGVHLELTFFTPAFPDDLLVRIEEQTTPSVMGASRQLFVSTSGNGIPNSSEK